MENRRFFNTAGPVDRRRHYCLPPLKRLNLELVERLIAQQKYFVLHAPRQTGKTTCLRELMKHLNGAGTYRCVYMNVEAAQTAREDIEQGMNDILRELASRAKLHLNDPLPGELIPSLLEGRGYGTALNLCLSEWCRRSAKPLVLMIDEIDALVGDTLISVLRQIRSGYDKRPANFPQSIILCGVRDVRDYRIHSDKEKAVITGGSAFNIKAKSLRLGDFSEKEMQTLYGEHTLETGQVFSEASMATGWNLTRGQPWLVNALTFEVCFEMTAYQDRSVQITPEAMRLAAENLIRRRETHLDQLVAKLKEERVRKVIAPMLAGVDLEDLPPDELQYTLDLGLIRQTPAGLDVANAIYREIIPRELNQSAQTKLEPRFQPSRFISADGLLETEKLISEFQTFFRENSEIWLERFDYKEAGPQLLLQAFLQRIINSGGRILREYGLARGRTDIMIVWPHTRGTQKVVIELKKLHKSLAFTIENGLRQIAAYLDRCGQKTGHLILFDRSPGKLWDEKIFRCEEMYKGLRIFIWGM